MTPLDILRAARTAGIVIAIDDNDNVVLEAEREPDRALLAELRQAKQEIVALLRAEKEWIPVAAEKAFHPDALAGARQASAAPLEAPSEPAPVKPPPQEELLLHAVSAPPSLPQTSDQVPLEPKHLADGRLMWRFAGGPPTDASPLALMTRARNHGAVLTRDGMTLIISSWSRLQPELVAALQRHSGTILQRLSRECAERIARFQRGEGGPVTQVLVFDPKQGDSE